MILQNMFAPSLFLYYDGAAGVSFQLVWCLQGLCISGDGLIIIIEGFICVHCFQYTTLEAVLDHLDVLLVIYRPKKALETRLLVCACPASVQ